MTRKTAMQIIDNVQKKQIDYSFRAIDEDVEKHIETFLTTHKELCDKALQEGWLGHKIQKCQYGLLGYMRSSFAMQIKILEKLDIPVRIPCYSVPTIKNFICSDFFKNATLENKEVKPIYKKEHFEIIKQKY
jgi:hypothetical protein